MKKIIWTCWFQGRRNAPDLVKRCLASWERKNPGWEVRCLDAGTVGLYIDIFELVDLERQSITAASLSDIIRILLLHEYGGVWVDATLYCNYPLDTWLPAAWSSGFFAFSSPGPDRLLSSWFLASVPGNPLIGKWAASVLNYWRNREKSEDYFWFHHLFGDSCATDSDARRLWSQVPEIYADGPHSFQSNDVMYLPAKVARSQVDWTAPVFKLTHRVDGSKFQSGCLLDELLRETAASDVDCPGANEDDSPVMRFAGLQVSTENLGDHIQILAAQQLLGRWGVTPSLTVDRDNEVASSSALTNLAEPAGILLNGWFKTNPVEWPPHPRLSPIYLGFHIRLFQAPSLLSAEALDHYRRHGPIGCRDMHTLALLRACEVEAFHSNCVSLLLARRFESPETQTDVFVVSRDERICEYIPEEVGPFTFVNHYSGTFNFATNMQRASELLTLYRSRAKLIITTLLHCALPAIAMGIPVVVFYPLNERPQHQSDRERFSSLARMIRIFSVNNVGAVDWGGTQVDCSDIKLDILDSFEELSAKWFKPAKRSLAPIALADILPIP